MQSADFQPFATFLAVLLLFLCVGICGGGGLPVYIIKGTAAASVAVASSAVAFLCAAFLWHLWRWLFHFPFSLHRNGGGIFGGGVVPFLWHRHRKTTKTGHHENETPKLFRICLNCFLKMYPHVYCKYGYIFGACAWICAKRSYAYFCADFVFSAVADAQAAAKNRPFCVRTQFVKNRRYF
ncbi:MAG: hypothetical protein J6Y33_03115 [Prevotella sp.]|nr:hypothetical protein [Prevotella sp.]